MTEIREPADVITTFCAATADHDVEGMLTTLSPDAELVSPLSARMVFRGHDDLRTLLAAVYGSLHQIHWHDTVATGSARVVVGDARIGPFRLGVVEVIDLDDHGRIERLRPHLRPWLGITVFALAVAPKMVRHPAVMWRALRRPDVPGAIDPTTDRRKEAR